MKKKERKQKKKMSKMKKLTIFVAFIDILVACCFILVYAVPNFKEKIISTAMITKTHQYIAYIFYSEDTIDRIMNANKYIPLTDEVDLDAIVIDTRERDSYDNEYDEAILTRDPGNEDYKYLKIKVGKYDAHLVAIYDPSKVKLISSNQFNTGSGQEQVIKMCPRNGGVVCINGGRFNDTTGYGSDIPKGTLIKNGKIIWSDTSKATNLIGFTNDNKLILTKATANDAIKMGIRDALQFGPFLMVNGKKIKYQSAAGGYDRAARVAIAQRRDGVVLFLVTEGVHTSGPTLLEVVETLEKYGAYNAANLDGGTSASLAIDGKLMNHPKTIYGKNVTGGRKVVSGFGLILNEPIGSQTIITGNHGVTKRTKKKTTTKTDNTTTSSSSTSSTDSQSSSSSSSSGNDSGSSSSTTPSGGDSGGSSSSTTPSGGDSGGTGNSSGNSGGDGSGGGSSDSGSNGD